jgi:RNA polymerase sigma-70 factor (ECF subfamily)
MALMIVLERLSPAERAAFVLHEVFQFSFDEVASIIDKSPAACRQLASRARRHVREETSPARFRVEPAQVQQIAEQFITAATSGNLDALMHVLDPNVVGHADSGGFVPAARQPIVGRGNVARGILGFLSKQSVSLVAMPVNGEPGVLGYRDGRLSAVVALSVREGLITHLHVVVNPDKLAYAASLLNVPTFVGDPASHEFDRLQGLEA